MSATAAPSPLSRLVAPYPVRIAALPGRGRGLVATRALPRGSLVMRSRVAGLSLRRKHQSLCCVACCAYSENWDRPAPRVCPECRTTYYCSDACRAADLPVHSAHCALLQSIDRAKSLKREEASLVRLLLRMLAECAAAARDEGGAEGEEADAS